MRWYAGTALAGLMIGLAGMGVPHEAQAAETAVRCVNGDCVSVICNETGDRCSRGPSYSGPDARDDYSGSGYAEAGDRRTCNSDGDRCYASTGGPWDFHVYYEGLGYRWVSPNDGEQREDVADQHYDDETATTDELNRQSLEDAQDVAEGNYYELRNHNQDRGNAPQYGRAPQDIRPYGYDRR